MSLAFLQIAMFAVFELALCYVVGRLCYAAFRLKQPTALHHAIAPAVGLSALALQLWLFGLVHVSWNVWLLLAPWAVAAVICRKSLSVPGKQLTAAVRGAARSFGRLDLLTKAMIVLGVVFLCIFLVRLSVAPLISSDTMGFWSLKAKEFFYHHAVFVDPFLNKSHAVGQFFHVDYPPFWPLMADVGYVLLGHIQEAVQKTTTWVLCISAVGAVWAFARQWLADNNKAVILAFISLAAPQFLNILFFSKNMAYADYPLAAMMLLSAIFLVRSLRERPNANWLFALLFASLAAVTKNEGLPFLVLAAAILVVRFVAWLVTGREKQAQRATVSVCVAALVLLPPLLWAIYKKTHHLDIEFAWHNLAASGMGAGERLQIAGQTTGAFLKYQAAYWWEVGALLLGTVAALWQRTREGLVVLTLIFGMLASYALSFVFSAHEVSYHVATSIDRLLTQILPLVLVLIIVLLAGAQPKKSSSV
jgi:hypothetical protein